MFFYKLCKINTIGIVTTHATLVKKIALLASVASSPYISAYTLELLATGIHIMSISVFSINGSMWIEPLITEVTRFLGTGFYWNLSYQAIPAVPAVLFVLLNLLICLASIYWWMHLHLCHDLNGILGMSILLLLNLLFLHSYIRNNDRSGCSHRMYPLSWLPFHTTRLYILAVL